MSVGRALSEGGRHAQHNRPAYTGDGTYWPEPGKPYGHDRAARPYDVHPPGWWHRPRRTLAGLRGPSPGNWPGRA